MHPYIGISDFKSFSQVEAMLEVFNKHRKPGSDYKLHAGVMMSYKTMNGLENSWSDIFPKNEEVAGIFQSEEAYNCLHYVDYDQSHTSVFQDLHKALVYGGINIDALQLDMIWPQPYDITEAVGRSCKDVEVILQVGKDAFHQACPQPLDRMATPEEIVVKLIEYDGVIDRVLLDLSMGRGVDMDSNFLIPYIESIKMNLPRMSIVVAGALGPNTIYLVEQILRMYPGTSIDAQSKLRPSGSARDPLDLGFCEKYLVETLKIV